MIKPRLVQTAERQKLKQEKKMPTGYTADVCDGKVTEFKDFALQCSRAFGALISMRDERADAPIPDEIKPDTSYYDQRLVEAQKRLGEVLRMTDAEAQSAADAAHAEALKHRADYIAKQDAEAARLNAMLGKVRAWSPPTPDHEELKNFMIQQLTVSLPGKYVPAIPEQLDGPTWRKREGDRLAEEIVRLKSDIAKEIERANGRNGWLRDLRTSLEPQPKAA